MATSSELLLTGKTLGLSNDSSDLLAASTIAEADLVGLALKNPSDDAKGARMKRARLLTVAVARGDTPKQQLFEEGYGIGTELSVPPEVAQVISPVVRSVFERNVAPQLQTSIDQTSYLPTNTTDFISNQSGDCLFTQAQQILLGGVAAGLVLRGNINIESGAGDIVSALPEQFIDYQLLKNRLRATVIDNPTAVVSELSPDIFESLPVLVEVEAYQKELLAPYLDVRLEPYIQAKQKRKVRTSTGKVVSKWSVDYEDINIQKAKEIAETPEDTFDVTRKLGVQKALREVLSEDIKAGSLPDELDKIMDIFILENGEQFKPGEVNQLQEAFVRFLKQQKEAKQQAEVVEAYMKKTKYWELSGRKQIVTPDTYEVSSKEMQVIQEINTAYQVYFSAIIEIYNQSVANYPVSEQAQQLVDRLEGGLPKEILPICRKLMALGGSIDSLRFDLIPTGNSLYQVGEAQIISGGTPPAVLYRNAFEQTGLTNFIGEGILPAFVQRCRQQTSDPQVVTLYSQRPYSSDISKTTSWAGNAAFIDQIQAQGIPAVTAFPQDTITNDDRSVSLKDVPNSKITTIYNRVDFVSQKAVQTLTDPSMLAILDAYANGAVDMFPAPLPILFGKGVYALIWDNELLPFLEERLGSELVATLRRYTPETYWITPDTDTANLDTYTWIRKGSYAHATLGLVMGPDVGRDTFTETVDADSQSPYSAVLQKYVDSETPSFRTKKQYRTKAGKPYSVWEKTPYRLRVEPTSINGKVCEVFVTGSADRIVHGRSDSIMTVATRKEEDYYE